MPRQSPVRTGFRWLLALIYLAAGVIHIRSPGGFVAITPDWVPSPHAVVFWTGVAEIAGAIGLMIPRLRRAGPVDRAQRRFANGQSVTPPTHSAHQMISGCSISRGP